MSTVSVVIPTHNRAKIVVRAIESVLEQTYENLELIVVDDGSSDETPSVVQRYNDVTYVRNEMSMGANVARNRGIETASGTFVATLDDDDAWEPEKLEKQVTRFEELGEEYALVYSGRRILTPREERDDPTPGIEGHVFKELLRRNFIPSEGVLIKRSCFGVVDDFDTGLKSSQDWDMWLRIAQKFKIGYCPGILARNYRTASNRITEDIKRQYQGHTKILQKYREDIEKDPVAFHNIHRKIGKDLLQMGHVESRNHFRKALSAEVKPTTLALYLISYCPLKDAVYEWLHELLSSPKQ